MKTPVVLTFLACLALLPQTQPCLADEAAIAALATESEAYCTSTIKPEPTPPANIVAKVNEACALLQKEGPAAFPKFSGKNSAFINEGTYIWIHTLDDSVMLMHPIKYKMNGTKITGMKDTKGKRLFAAMNDLVREKGEGWVEYYWPKPGTQDSIHKISFVKKCKMPDGVEVVVGSGLYNISHPDVTKLELH